MMKVLLACLAFLAAASAEDGCMEGFKGADCDVPICPGPYCSGWQEPKLEIYTLLGCLHCQQVMQRMWDQDVQFKQIEVDDSRSGDITQAELGRRIRDSKPPEAPMPNGAPFFFFDGTFIGGGSAEGKALKLALADKAKEEAREEL